MMHTSTYFALLAEFGTAEIELSKVCSKYFGLTEAEAKRRATLNRLPVPAFHTGSQKSPWLVSAVDLARHIDSARETAFEEWKKSQAARCADYRASLRGGRSEEHTSEHQSLMRISYAGFC